jgi:hypothetical protein
VSKGEDREILVLGDVPLPAGVPHPKQGMTVWYGYEDTAEQLKKQHATARMEERNLVKVSFKLEVGTVPDGSVTPADVPTLSFLNLKRRASRELQEIIVTGVNMIAAKANRDPVLFDRCPQVGARPDLLCQFLRSDPMFQHIKAVAYEIPDGPHMRQVVTFFSNDVQDVVIRRDSPFDIALPPLSTKSPTVIFRKEDEMAVA